MAERKVEPELRDRLLIDDGPVFVRALRWRDGRAVALELLPVAEASDAAAEGSIWFGRVRKVMPDLQAAFVDLGAGRGGGAGESGFLNAADAGGEDDGDPAIGRRLREGQGLMVQVLSAPHGGKGAKLGAQIALPGRLALLRPGKPGVKFSHRFPPGAARTKLASVVAHLVADDGVTLRAAARMAPPQLLVAEVERLKRTWGEISARGAGARTPACLWREPDALGQVLRDHADGDIGAIGVASAAGFSRARAWLSLHAPELLDRLQPRPGANDASRYEELEDEFARALAPVVKLGGGGVVRFDTGAALTAIDVDSAGAISGGDREDAAWRVNREAADEIARQLRLRNLGGAVVVDFLRQGKAENRARLLAHFRRALADDPAAARVLGFSRLGLVELTRRRRAPSLLERWFDACEACGGGSAPGARATAHMALIRAGAEGGGRGVKRVRIRCAPAVARVIELADAAAIALRISAPVVVESDGGGASGAFTVVLE